MRIRCKKDIAALLNQFEQVSQYDRYGRKYYIPFYDKERGGTCTIMKYKNDSYTIHGQGVSYCDNGEKPLLQDELLSLIWKHRKAFSEAIKNS
ncbi:hypothetical protein [Metabacillus fastidiosus]|uniref:hypothetical protein n=1 Tax=Metabacillus fastidiosus TaxID=1458 RepID=UPI003D2B300E